MVLVLKIEIVEGLQQWNQQDDSSTKYQANQRGNQRSKSGPELPSRPNPRDLAKMRRCQWTENCICWSGDPVN